MSISPGAPHDRAAVTAWAGHLERRTPNTLTGAGAFHQEPRAIRERGYAIDENEPGIVCVAVPAYRTPPARLVGDVAAIREPVAR